MPAAHDIYNEELRVLRRGDALYHPEPAVGEMPVEIGDVGYTTQGGFCRLFNACRPADDPINEQWGVPEGFQPLDMGRVRTYDRELGPGPLHSQTIGHAALDIGTSSPVLPAGAPSIFHAHRLGEQFLSQQQGRFKQYLEKHCLAWYKFASDHDILVDFGDIILVTECSKTTSWASAVYSQSSRDFGLHFSVGGSFLPIENGLGASAGYERLGSVQHRRSQRRVIASTDVEVPHDQTVFIKGYRPAPRHLYPRSFAAKIRKLINRSAPGRRDQDASSSPGSGSSLSGPSPSSHSSRAFHVGDLADDVASVTPLSLEMPDYHPSVALLAHEIETTRAEVVIVHDDEWCSIHNEDTERIIDDYAQAFFDEEFLIQKPAKFGKERDIQELTGDIQQSIPMWMVTVIVILLLLTAVILLDCQFYLKELWNWIRNLVAGTGNCGCPVSDVSTSMPMTCDPYLHARIPPPELFSWPVFSQKFGVWLLPWLALVSQLPFGGNNKLDNIVSVLLTVGSPVLAGYSLVLTILNTRWVARRFARYKCPNVEIAVHILSSLQQSPLTRTTTDSLLTSLVVLPENDERWNALATQLDDSYRWSMSMVASVAWAIIAYAFTLKDSFAGDTSGQVIGTLWLWLLPIIIGWLQFSPCDLTRRHRIGRANRVAYGATPSGNSVSVSSLWEDSDYIYAISHPLSTDDPTRCDEYRTAPIYNYSRFLLWTQCVEEISKVFRAASDRAQRHRADWKHSWARPINRMGTFEQGDAYCFPFGEPEFNAGESCWTLWSRFLLASVLALSLQWFTTVAAMVIACTSATGLGCRLGTCLLLYAMLSTISWMVIVLSSFLSYYSTTVLRKNLSTGITRKLSIILRRLGKVIAFTNAIWIVILCLSLLLDRYCWNSWDSGVREPTADCMKCRSPCHW